MPEVVKEFITKDGIGAMLWKKLYSMSYCYRHKVLFHNTPFDWFFVHESDHITTKEQYIDTLNKFNSLLYNPWADIDFDNLKDYTLSDRVGLGAGNSMWGPGFIEETDFLLDAPVFNKHYFDNNNNIVIHLRRGNAIPENPRYVEDEFYLNVLSNIHKVIEKFKLDNPNIIICTDAADHPTTYKPIPDLSADIKVTRVFHKNDVKCPKDKLYHVEEYENGLDQKWLWGQSFLYPDANGEYPVTSANFDEYRKVCPQVVIQNKLSTYDSFLLMLKAKVYITSNSAFSQCAGLLSHNKVIGMCYRRGMSAVYNKFKNQVGVLSETGDILL